MFRRKEPKITFMDKAVGFMIAGATFFLVALMIILLLLGIGLALFFFLKSKGIV